MSCVSKILCQKCNPASSTACAHFNKVTSHRIQFSCWSSTALKPKFKPWALHKLTLFYYRHTSVRRKKKKFLQVKYFPDLFLNSNTPLFHCHLGLFVSCQNATIFIALPFQSHFFTSFIQSQCTTSFDMKLSFSFFRNKVFLPQLPEHQRPSSVVLVSLCCCASASHKHGSLSPL